MVVVAPPVLPPGSPAGAGRCWVRLGHASPKRPHYPPGPRLYHAEESVAAEEWAIQRACRVELSREAPWRFA